MRFDVFSLFPNLMQPYLEGSILERAIQNQLLDVHLHDIRAWTTDRHHVTDEPPFGGGGGMVMKAEPIFAAVEDVSMNVSANIWLPMKFPSAISS
jgi:tRNA (guanine37-N1)-methyltransferase